MICRWSASSSSTETTPPVPTGSTISGRLSCRDSERRKGEERAGEEGDKKRNKMAWWREKAGRARGKRTVYWYPE